MLDYMTVEQMVAQVARHVQEINHQTNVVSTPQRTRILESLNTIYSDVVCTYKWPALMQAKETGITAAAGSTFVYLPKYVQQVYLLLPSLMQSLAPHQVVERFMGTLGSVKDVAGPIRTWTDAGEVGRKADFSTTAETLTISNAGTFDVVVHGLTSTDDEVTETVAISGNAAPTLNTYTDLFSVSSDGRHTSTITVTGTSSARTYCTISTQERSARYRRIRLWQIPSGQETLAIYYKKRVATLTRDDQVPELPVSHVLVNRAIALQYSGQRKWQTAFQAHDALAERALERIIAQESLQGERFEQAVPMVMRRRRSHGSDTVIVSNG